MIMWIVKGSLRV